MASDDDVKALARLTLRHNVLIDTVLGICNDFARLIEPNLERCSAVGCKCPATVSHVDVDVKMCDYHAAKGIFNAQKNLAEEEDNTLAGLRLRLADENCWIDVPNADLIRRLDQYVNELRKSDEIEPPANKAEFH